MQNHSVRIYADTLHNLKRLSKHEERKVIVVLDRLVKNAISLAGIGWEAVPR